MKRPDRVRAPQGAVGTCRDRRRQQGEPRPAWVRPLRRARRAISASARLIGSTMLHVEAVERHARRRPVRTSRTMHDASARLVDVSVRLQRAASDLARTHECLARDPASGAGVPELLFETAQRLLHVGECLGIVAADVFARHADVLRGLATGVLVPEQAADRRPRIRLTPQPAPIRAFLRARQPRVIDRIASILRRRRRTPRPAAVRAPRRSVFGRAPPLFPVCPL